MLKPPSSRPADMATKSENAASLGELFARELGARELERLRRRIERDGSVLGDLTRLLLEGDVVTESAPRILGGSQREPRLEPGRARASLDARTGAPWAPDGELLTSAQMATRIGLRGRQGVHHRLRQGTLVGFELGRRGTLFPTAQLDGHGRVLDGIGDVLALLPDARWAWRWLTEPTSALDDDVPLERLRRGDREAVVAAAHGVAQGDFS